MSKLKKKLGNKEYGKKILVDYPRKLCLRDNECCLILIVGMSGKGKTWAALRIAESIDPDFTVDRFVNTYEDWVNLLNREDLKPGSVIIFDEFQVDANSRRWYTDINKAIGDILSTFRHMNLVMIVTTPRIQLIDKNARSSFHFVLDIKKKLKTRGVVQAKIMMLETKANDPKSSDESNRWRPRIYTKHKGLVRVSTVYIHKPSIKLRNAVEKKVDKFKKKVRKDIQKNIVTQKKVDKRKTKQTMSYEERIKLLHENLDKMVVIKDGKKILSVELVALFFGVGPTTARSIVKLYKSTQA